MIVDIIMLMFYMSIAHKQRGSRRLKRSRRNAGIINPAFGGRLRLGRLPERAFRVGHIGLVRSVSRHGRSTYEPRHRVVDVELRGEFSEVFLFELAGGLWRSSRLLLLHPLSVC